MAIEAAHYREEEERLALSPTIQGMARELMNAGQVETFLADPDAMTKTCRAAEQLGVEFNSIGGPHRAILRVLSWAGYDVKGARL